MMFETENMARLTKTLEAQVEESRSLEQQILAQLKKLAMEVREVPFAHLLEKIVDNRGKTCPTADYGIPLIATNCIRNTSLYPNHEKIRYVSQETYDSWFRGHPKPGDLIFVTKGTPGRVCMVPDPIDFCIAQDMVAIRADGEKIDPRYLFAVLRSQEVQRRIENMHVGTLIPHFKKGDFDKLFLPVPERKVQEFIGEIYFTLSYKIELNQQMNRTLEGIARALFKSWFIDFDPVRAKLDGRQPAGMDAETAALFPDSFEDSPLGKIPKGWEVQKIGEVATINSRSIKKGYNHETIEYVDIASVTIGKLENTTTYILSDAPSRAKRLVKHGDIIWSGVRPNRRSYLFIHTPPENLVVSTGFVVLTPKSIPASYLYAWVTTDEFVDYLTFSADGSAYPAVRPDRFSDAKILVAPDGILNKFEQQAGKLRDKIIQNDRESLSLAATRDALLPKLLSGEIRVKEAEQALEEVT